MRDFFVFGHLARWVLAVILGLLLLAGIAVWRNWVVAQALANATDTPALFQSTPPALVPITTPIWARWYRFSSGTPTGSMPLRHSARRRAAQLGSFHRTSCGAFPHNQTA